MRGTPLTLKQSGSLPPIIRRVKIRTPDGFIARPELAQKLNQDKRPSPKRSGHSRLLQIVGGTFFRHYPLSVSDDPKAQAAQIRANPPLFPSLSLSLDYREGANASSLPESVKKRNTWCIVGPSLSGKTALLQVLRGEHICKPPTARVHYIDPKSVRYAGFDTAHRGGGLGQLASSYLAERYESHREITDFTLRDYLLDNTQLNPSSTKTLGRADLELFNEVVAGLDLESLLDLPMTFLSNGQGRRAQIAHALLHRPRLLLLDEPFIGLDPPTVIKLNRMLWFHARSSLPKASPGRQRPALVLTARPQDPIPSYVTHLVYLTTDCRVAFSGKKDDVLRRISQYAHRVDCKIRKESPIIPLRMLAHMGTELSFNGIRGSPLLKDLATYKAPRKRQPPRGEILVEMNGCTVKYGDKVVLGNWEEQDRGTDGSIRKGLHWTVQRGERWGVFGPNGSGKTTIVSLLCSDHPQTYSLPIKLFGRPRLPEPGSDDLPLTFWDIQRRIGHTSPEVHQHMPRNLSVRRVLESAWADTFGSKPDLVDGATEQIDAVLTWFAPELNPSSQSLSLDWANDRLFGGLSYSAQRILLFLRAIVKHPDIVVLDEAFSGMDDLVRDKCMEWLEWGNSQAASLPSGTARVDGLRDEQALICISHLREEVPDCVRDWICLPEANTGKPPRQGGLDEPLRRSGPREWEKIWDLNLEELGPVREKTTKP